MNDSDFRSSDVDDGTFIDIGGTAVGGPGVVARTVLGSCISVYLFDQSLQVGAINHFLLPAPVERHDKQDRLATVNSTNYGAAAIDEIVTQMKGHGSTLDSMVAKIFGGARIHRQSSSPGDQNIGFVSDYLSGYGIATIGGDTGGVSPRRLIVDLGSGKVMLQKLPAVTPVVSA